MGLDFWDWWVYDITTMKIKFEAKPFAVVCMWKDNPNDFAVIEYFYHLELALEFANKKNRKNKENCKYEVMEYV